MISNQISSTTSQWPQARVCGGQRMETKSTNSHVDTMGRRNMEKQTKLSNHTLHAAGAVPFITKFVLDGPVSLSEPYTQSFKTQPCFPHMQCK